MKVRMLSLLTFLSLMPLSLRAATGDDFMQSVGKMYVVVTVICLLFIGLALYIYRLDRRIAQLEKSNQEEASY